MTASGVIDDCLLSAKPKTVLDKDGRPITSAIKGKSLTTLNTKVLANISEENSKNKSLVGGGGEKKKTGKYRKGFKCKNITITILNTWEDNYYVGLTSIEILD